jgi:hypothetical protein
VSLISSGGEGGLVYLLGSANEGHDVFFTTQAKLGPNDNDVALDVYDARIEGGEPPLAARPVECEGDACSTPPATPLDLTPASLTFNGIGEVLPATSVAPNAKAKAKAKKKTTGKKTMHRTTRKKHRGRTALKTGKSNRRKGR